MALHTVIFKAYVDTIFLKNMKRGNWLKKYNYMKFCSMILEKY